MKWLAAAAALVIAVGAVLLYSVVTDDATPAPADPPVAAPSVRDGNPVATRPPIADARPAVARVEDDPEGPQPAWPDIADARTDEFMARGAEFFERVDDYSRQKLPSMVADCYKGGEDPKAKLKLHYRLSVERHVVTLRDVKVVEGTIKNQAVVDCMVRALEGVRFEDINMPDFLSAENDPETVRIRIESLKRFYPDQDEGSR